ncbi:MAG: hypothetical protein ACQEQE_10595 [Bacillota bacterium]
MLRVIEVAKKLGVSKVTIYKKIKKIDKLKKHITKRQNITYIKEEGIEIIKENLEKFKDDKVDLKKIKDNQIKSLEEYKIFLQNQIEIKKVQLDMKNQQISNIKNLVKINKKHLEKLKKTYQSKY